VIQISEFQPNPDGADPSQVPFEISGGTPGESFSGVILSIENDGSSATTVDRLSTISGTFDANGLLTVNIPDLENPSFTVVLAEGYTGSVGAPFDQSALTNVLDAIGVPDATGDEANLLGAQLGGVDFSFVGSEPQLIFRTADGNLFAVNANGDEVFDIDGNDVDESAFGFDPTTPTFGTANPECFLTGTLIATDEGECLVETLKVGDLVQTTSGRPEHIKWVGVQVHDHQNVHPFRSYPIQIKAGALGDNLPTRDLYVTPDHALLVDGVLANAGALTNGISIVQVKPEEETFTYYHIELEHHTLLLAEGVPAESFIPQNVEGRDKFDNIEEFAELYPEGGSLAYMPMSFPRVSSQRQLPRSIAKRLLQVAQTLPDVQKSALSA